jgi:predicted S18 family serine protease
MLIKVLIVFISFVILTDNAHSIITTLSSTTYESDSNLITLIALPQSITTTQSTTTTQSISTTMQSTTTTQYISTTAYMSINQLNGISLILFMVLMLFLALAISYFLISLFCCKK